MKRRDKSGCTEWLQIRMTRNEKQKLKAHAKRAGLTLSDYVRQVLGLPLSSEV